MKFIVTYGKQPDGLPKGDVPAEQIRSYYTELLAGNGDSEVFDVGSVSLEEKASDSFRKINGVFSAIMDYGREHGKPGVCRFFCETEEQANMYRVVYNFYYAGIKEDRLEVT